MEKVLSRKEAAQAASVSLATIDRAVSSGQLPVKKHGWRTLILEGDLARFVGGLPGKDPEGD
jgi:hypothetical protein